MSKRIGTYIIKKNAGESYKAYIPADLPPKPNLDLDSLYPLLEKATLALAELNSMVKLIPNPSLFIYMYVRKEALLSSQIEGTQSSFSDLMLFEHKQKTNIELEDVEEVSNYVKAINHGLQRIKNNFPLSLRLLREMHKILLSGTRGSGKLPGEFRKSQNWIGGTRPGNALFVPPPIEYMDKALSDLEKFLHDDSLPILIKAALIHLQFETIHPFLDGNGRLGRMLITLMLCEGKILEEPILYLSLYLKQHSNTYYSLLQEVRLHGTWETWVEFFLEGVLYSSKKALNTTQAINKLFADDIAKIEALGRIKFSCNEILDYLKKLPQVSVTHLSKVLNMTAPTARNSLNHMIQLGIVEEISSKKRDKIYIYRKYLNILEEGTEAFKGTEAFRV